MPATDNVDAAVWEARQATSSLRTAGERRCDDGVHADRRDLERLLAGDAIRRGIDTAQYRETLARAEAALRDALARATALARAEVQLDLADGSLGAGREPVTLAPRSKSCARRSRQPPPSAHCARCGCHERRRTQQTR